MASKGTNYNASHDILVNGNLLKAGVYALYAFPDKENWEIVFHSDLAIGEMAEMPMIHLKMP